MKLKIEISNEECEEVIIKCKEVTDKIKQLQDVINNCINENAEITLYSQKSEYYIKKGDILFFETYDKRTSAHTSENMFYSDYKLFELEKILPISFVRVSKSCILNTEKVSSVIKNVTGASEVQFKNSYKKVYVSRMYYKIFKERIEKTRLLK